MLLRYANCVWVVVCVCVCVYACMSAYMYTHKCVYLCLGKRERIKTVYIVQIVLATHKGDSGMRVRESEAGEAYQDTMSEETKYQYNSNLQPKSRIPLSPETCLYNSVQI